MRKSLFWAALIVPMFSIAQQQGVAFVHKLSWQELQAKAQAEDKYIFVDCYTTWCGPCKYMDRNVYANDTLGELMNALFVSVKVQMDTTKSDDADVQSWYGTAHMMAELYHVQAYPSYLFFSPNGKIVHKDLGGLKMADFMDVAKTAADPQHQYYTLLDAYEQGHKDYTVLPYLAGMTRKFGEEGLTQQIAEDYVHHLETLSLQTLWSKSNITFIAQYSEVFSSKDRIFQLYRRDTKFIDSVMEQPGYSDALFHTLAYREEVRPYVELGIKNNKEPQWQRMEKRIEKGFGKSYVEKNVVKGRIEYYKASKEWGNYAKYFFRQAQDQGIQTWKAVARNAFYWNNYAYEIFLYSNDRKELETALIWVERALSVATKPDPQTMDTKANLLYKLGRINEGLSLEFESSKLAPNDKDIQENYGKMKRGLPTWIE